MDRCERPGAGHQFIRVGRRTKEPVGCVKPLADRVCRQGMLTSRLRQIVGDSAKRCILSPIAGLDSLA